MIVFDGTVKSKALVCLVFSHLFLVLARGNYSVIRNRTKKSIVQEKGEILKINKQITVFLSGKESRVQCAMNIMSPHLRHYGLERLGQFLLQVAIAQGVIAKVKKYQYIDTENHEHNLSVTITPCSTTVKWSFVYHTIEEIKNQNSTEFMDQDETAEIYENDGMKTVTMEKAQKGWYYIIFQPLGKEAKVTIYLTMDGTGPYELTIPQKSNLLLVPLRRHRIKVSWQPSLVNPQNTSYCLVINTRKEYPSMCGAEEDAITIKELDVPPTVNLNNLSLEKWRKGKGNKIQIGMKFNNDTVIVCVGKKIQLMVTKVKKGVKYYFNLFAINNKTNLTIPYGKSIIRYNFPVKPILIKDGARKLVNLKNLEGKATFRFKVQNRTRELHFYVISCGGAIDVEIKKKELIRRTGRKSQQSANSIPKRTRVFGYKRFRILYPMEGEQYYLKVNAPNIDELTRSKYVEVFVTQHPAQRYPLPLLPDEPNLYEFKSQKTCNSVTIGWVPVLDTSVNTYCVHVWENRKISYADLWNGSFQCNLDDVYEKKLEYTYFNESLVSSECEDMVTMNKKSITNYKIRDLKPGKSYTIQVTVKKKNGRTLSYRYLRVFTKHACEH